MRKKKKKEEIGLRFAIAIPSHWNRMLVFCRPAAMKGMLSAALVIERDYVYKQTWELSGNGLQSFR